MNLGTDTFHDPLASNDVGTKPELRAFLPGTDKSKPTGSDSTNRGNFVLAMRAAVTGVNVVTTDGPGGRFGLTVSAMCSVSADPPTACAPPPRRPVPKPCRRMGGNPFTQLL